MLWVMRKRRTCCGICCTLTRFGHRTTIIRRARQDDDGDRDYVLGVGVYGLRGQTGDHVSSTITAAGLVYKRTIMFVYLGGSIRR